MTLVQYLKANHLTYEEAAKWHEREKIVEEKITRQRVGQLVKGKTHPSYPLAIKLERECGVPAASWWKRGK